MFIGQNFTKITKSIINWKKSCVQKAKVLFFTDISEKLTFCKQSLRENQGLNFVFPSNKIIYNIRKFNS